MLFAAVVYLGGAALGQWSSPFASVNGAFVSGSTSGATASGLSAAADASTVAAEAAGGAATAAEGAVVADTAIASAADTAAGLGSASTANTVAAQQAGGSVVPQGGFINNAMKVAGKVGEYGGKAAEFADRNKLLTVMGFNAIAGASAADAARKAEKEERRRMQENLAVGQIDLGVSPGAKFAQNPMGSINSRMRG